ncbi:hypothetical protein U1Q18_020474 [Sarracenia purpurea var. burkii]
MKNFTQISQIIMHLSYLQHHSHVPKFGNWESEENVPYTAYFDKARKGRSDGKMINPNDPQENPDLFPIITPPAQAPPFGTREDKIGREAIRPAHERRGSRGDGDFSRFTASPARNNDIGRRGASESAHQHHTDQGPGSTRPIRQSVGSERNIERSPLHPHYQAKVMGKSNASPAREGKNSYDSSQGTPGRSRMKPASWGDDTVSISLIINPSNCSSCWK